MRRLSAYIRKTAQALVLGTAMCIPSFAHAQDITTGLVGHWTMDQISGTTISDATGNYDATWGGSPSVDVVPGVFGNAVRLTEDTNYIDLGINAGLDNLQPVSFAAWIRPSSLNGGAFGVYNVIYSTDQDAAPGGGWGFYLNASGQLVQGSECTGVANVSSETIPLNEWTHVAVSWTPSSSVALYINGEEVSYSTSSAPAFCADSGTTKQIGSANGRTDWNMHGLMDDARLYNRELTAADIAALFEAPEKSCEIQNRGSIIYNTDGQVMQYCDSTSWVAMGKQRYVPEAAGFNPADTDWLSRGGDLTGIADTKQVTGSVWIRRGSYGGGAVHEIYSASNRFRINIDVSDNVRVIGSNSTPTSILSHSSGPITDGDWHHLLFSIDMANQAGSYVYVDDVDVTNFFTFTDDVLDVSTSGHSVGANGGSNLYDGDIADLWFDTGTYIDLSIAENRRKFIDASGNPADLGPNGEGPLGSAPDIFLSGDIASWHTNKGSGGGWTENGALSEGIGPSKITGGVSNLSPVPACPISYSAHSFSLAGTLPATDRDFLGIWVDPPYIFAGNGWMGGDTPLEVYTFDGSNFTVVDSVLSGHGFPEYIWSDGEYYYLAAPGSGLYVYDFDGTNLTLLDSDTINAIEARGPWGDGEYIYVADGADGFHAYTFDGSTLAQVGTSVTSNGFSLATYSDGEYVYLGDGAGGLRVYTFDGANWTFIDESTTYNTRRIWDDQNYIYAVGAGGLVAYDFDGTTLTPIAAETANIGGNSDVWGDGQFIYVAASGTNGVRVYDFNGSEFTLVDTYSSVNDMRSIGGDGTFIYAGDRDQGLYALNGFDCLQCSNPEGRAGDLIYNSTTSQMQYCNAEQWVAMGPTGNGGGGCTNPNGALGDLIYNTTFERMQYCEGDEWIAIGDAASVAPDCLNIGDLCSDGTLYGGDIDYGSGPEKIYVTDNNQSTGSIWSNLTVDTNADSQLDGQLNQTDIVTNHTLSQYPAFETCENLNQHGNTDWYLPALDELEEISSNRVAINANAAGPFITSASAAYWSSSEFDSAEAYTMGLDSSNNPASDTTAEIPKTNGDSGPFGIIRCIRRD